MHTDTELRICGRPSNKFNESGNRLHRRRHRRYHHSCRPVADDGLSIESIINSMHSRELNRGPSNHDNLLRLIIILKISLDHSHFP